MHTENEQSDNNSKKPVKPSASKKQRGPVPLSLEEIELLKAKRFIDNWEVMRFFSISRSTLYNMIKEGKLQYSKLGSKKVFDLTAIFLFLEKRKGNGK